MFVCKKRLEERLKALQKGFSEAIQAKEAQFDREISALHIEITTLKMQIEKMTAPATASEDAETYAKLIDEWKNGPEDSE